MLFSSETSHHDLRVLEYHTTGVRTQQSWVVHSSVLTGSTLKPIAVRHVNELDDLPLHTFTELNVSILILTTPDPLVWPSAQWRAQLSQRGIGVEVMALGAACRTFNLLLSDERDVALVVIFPQA